MSSPAVTLVTGATGMVGNNVVRQLLQAGERVRVLARDTADERPLHGLNVERIAGDVRDKSCVERACQGVTAVIHCAGNVRVGWQDPQLYEAINVDGTRHVAAACRAVGARLVHVSSTDVFGRCSLVHPTNEDTPWGAGPQVPYVVTKRAAEQVVRGEVDAGLDAVIVNPSFMLGPWDWKPSSGALLLAVARGSGIIAPRGWLSLSDVRDVAGAILVARDQAPTGRQYILAGETMRWIDAFRICADVSDARPPLATMGIIGLSIAGWTSDLRSKLTGHEPEVNSASIAMSRLAKNYSSARAQRELGYQIRPPRQIAADAWQWFQEHGYP